MQDIESPGGHGRARDEKHLLPLLMTRAPAPESLLELTTCNHTVVVIRHDISARRLPACETAPATTQGFLALMDATVWQMI